MNMKIALGRTCVPGRAQFAEARVKHQVGSFHFHLIGWALSPLTGNRASSVSTYSSNESFHWFPSVSKSKILVS